MNKELLLSPRSLLHVLILGDHSTGKTSILYKYMNLMKHVNITTGYEQHLHHIKMHDKKYCINIFDMSGHYSCHKILEQLINNNNYDGIIFVFDLTSINSFNNLNYWMDLSNSKYKNNKLRILIGNKSDKLNKTVSMDKIKEFSKKNNINYFETSFITNTNITTALDLFFNNLVESTGCNNVVVENNIDIKINDQPKRNCCFIDIHF